MLLKNNHSKWSCILSIIFLFSIYNLTISPTIYWRDSPELIDTSYSLGIAHPAGFPAYTLISKIFTFLPLSNIAMRVNYVSLLFAVLTCWIIFYVIIELINICFKPKSNYQASLSAMFGVLILGLALSYWWQATVSEVYTMNGFFLSVFFLAAIKWYQSKEPKYLILASFIFGISTAVYGANLLFVPAPLVFYFLTKCEKPLNQLILAIIFFLFGYSIYLDLPVRSFTNPTFDWGNPETFRNFISHITGQKDSGQYFSGGTNLFLIYKNIVSFIQMIITEITLLGFFLAIAGAICHFKKDKSTFFLLALIGFIHTAFFMTSLSAVAKNGSLFLSSFIIFASWIGLGIYFLIAESSGYVMSFKYKNITIPVVISFIVFSCAKNYPYNDKSQYYLPRDHSREMYIALEQNALVFSSLYWFFFRYYKDVENLRPDISIISISEIISPDVFNQVTPNRFQMLNFPLIESKKENRYEFMQLLIRKNINEKPIYWELKRDLTKYNYQYLIPGIKFLMRFVGHKINKIPREVLEKYLLKLKRSIDRELDDEQFFLDQEMGVRSYYYTFLRGFAHYLIKRKMYQKALPFLDLALTISDFDDADILTLKGVCYMNSGNLKKAEEIFLRLLSKNKESYENNYNLASLYFGKGEFEKAKGYLKNIRLLDKDFIKSYFLLGQIYEKEGKYEQAIKEINYAIGKTKFKPDKKRMQATLERVKSLKEENSAGARSVQPSTDSNID